MTSKEHEYYSMFGLCHILWHLAANLEAKDAPFTVVEALGNECMDLLTCFTLLLDCEKYTQITSNECESYSMSGLCHVRGAHF